MMSSFHVEKALRKDAEWIGQSQVAMALETENLHLNPEDVIEGVEFIFENPECGFYVIAKNKEQASVGCLVILKEWSDWRNGDVWWIHSVYVLQTYRKHGIFRKMFEYVENLARVSDIRGLRLYVDKNNKSAQTVYEKLGMTKDHYELFEKIF